MCFVIATEYIGTFRWGKDGKIDNILAQDSSHIGTIKKDYWGRENQNAYLEYDTSNTDYAFNKANSYLFKNGQNGYVGGAGEFFLISLYANEINECLLMVGGTIMSNRMWTSTRNTKFSIYQSSKKRLDTVYIRGGVPMEDRQEIDSQVDTIKELLEQDSVVLAIALTTSPYYGFRVSVIAPPTFFHNGPNVPFYEI